MTPTDILNHIATGRLVVERGRADSLSRTLADVEAMLCEFQPTTAPDVAAGLADVADVRRALTADIVELEEMRKALDRVNYAPTLAGLREALSEAERAVRVWKEQDEALRAERDALRAEVAALAPGPWTRLGDGAPDLNEVVLMWTGVLGAPAWIQTFSGIACQTLPADYRWRRIPGALLAPPEVTP